MINLREYFSPRKRLKRFQRVWNAGGDTAAGLTNRVQATVIATMTCYDTLIDLNDGLDYNGSGPFPGGVYVSEGFNGGTNQDDVDRINVATMTISNNIADSGAIRAGSGVCSGPLKLWILGGSTSSYYDDVSDMCFANETMHLYAADQLSTARTRMGAVSTDMKIMSVGGLYSSVERTVIEGWPHSTETLMDIGDLQTGHDWVSCNLSDTAFYATRGAENERFSLSTETTVDVNTPANDSIDGVQGNGHFDTGAIMEGGYVSGQIDDIYLMSFATETWIDTTQSLGLAVDKIGPCSGG